MVRFISIDFGSKPIISFPTFGEDGTKVYVNFGFKEYLENGIYVRERDYKVVR